jgi:hypothetical protein
MQIQIANYQLITDIGAVIDLPHLAVDAVVRVWTVPAEYRAIGIYVSTTPKGAAIDEPASEFVGPIFQQTLPAHPDAVLAAKRAAKIQEISDTAEIAAAQLTAGYPDFETKTWTSQEAEALAWDADKTAPTPRINAMAQWRGIDREDYLARTLSKVVRYHQASDYLVGTRQKYVDQANAATLDTIDTIRPVFTLG